MIKETDAVEDSIRHFTAQASAFKSHKKDRDAAFKAWRTMRATEQETMLFQPRIPARCDLSMK